MNLTNNIIQNTHRGEPFVFISDRDAADLRIENGEKVKLVNDVGEMLVAAKVTAACRPGQVILYNGFEPYMHENWYGQAGDAALQVVEDILLQPLGIRQAAAPGVRRGCPDGRSAAVDPRDHLRAGGGGVQGEAALVGKAVEDRAARGQPGDQPVVVQLVEV